MQKEERSEGRNSPRRRRQEEKGKFGLTNTSGKGNFDELSKVGWTTTHVSVRGKVFLFTGSKSRECFGFIFSRFSGHFARFLWREVQD